ncbi:MAG: MarR family winged helix-turn-helix transcriptional regulator [Gemmatimonadota bacterium]
MATKAKGAGIVRESRLDDAPAYLIQRTSRLLRVLFLRTVRHGDAEITPEMWLVLGCLVVRDGQCQNELADSTFRDRPNISRILAGLERRRMVRREPDPADGRKVRVYLTPPGRAVLKAYAPVAARTRDRIYADLSREDLSVLRRILGTIERNALAALASLEASAEGPADRGAQGGGEEPKAPPAGGA